jgi:hypothetical protein
LAFSEGCLVDQLVGKLDDKVPCRAVNRFGVDAVVLMIWWMGFQLLRAAVPLQ